MDFIFVLSILILGFIFANGNNFSKTDKKKLNLLWMFHICTSIYYYFFTRNGGGDAWRYWVFAREMTFADFIKNLFTTNGSEFMDTLNYIPANLMGMSFFANTLFYGLLGFIAFILLYRICIDTIPYNSQFYKHNLFPLLLFLPNLHFWSSGIGKDTMLFLCIIMIGYGIMRTSRRFPMIVVGLLLAYVIRPHVALMLVGSFGLTYFLNSKTPLYQRAFFIVLLIMTVVFMLPVVLEFTKIEEASLDGFEQFSGKHANFLTNAGSAVDIASYPYPLKVLTFLYRPFFFDINGIPAVIASFENLFLVLLSVQLFRKRPFAAFKAAPVVIQGLFIFFASGALVFSTTMSNLGIILRQRNMFLPGFILFVLWCFSYKQQINLRKNNA